jgi:HlyD family secretion protein
MAVSGLESRQRVSGAAMDRQLPKKRRNYYALGAGAIALLVILVVLLWWLLPHGLRVHENELRIAVVKQGMFHNDVVTRATAAPLRTVVLDALETGRVEEILVNDGSLVTKGELLFRLSNSQLRLNLIARQSERAQQVSNLSNLRVSIETSQTEHQQRMLDLGFALDQAEKLHARYAALGTSGYVSASTLEESVDRVEKQRQALADEKTRAAIEMRIKREGLKQIEQAVEQLDTGLKVVNESLEELAVRAPIAGRLTDFHLQLGEIVKPDLHIGRIDDPSQFKFIAKIDEYYLGNITIGKKASANINGHNYALEVSSVFPQITDGRFSVELLFSGEAPAELSPGQSAETSINLGEMSPGLVLPNDAYLNDSGGSWAYVLTPDGKGAERRAIRIAQRNNSQVVIASGLSAGERVIISSYAPYRQVDRIQVVR